MSRRLQKKNPELNVTSFCDIITVSIFALFMVLLVVIDLAMRTPVLFDTPLARDTTNSPVYVECRNNQLYFIDRAEIAGLMQSALSDIHERSVANQPYSMEETLSLDIGNDYYQMDNRFMLMGLPVLLPRPGVKGVSPPSSSDVEPGPFERFISMLDSRLHYVVYLVRDDSFYAYRRAREYVVRKGFIVGWEYLGREEPISFDGAFRNVKAE